MRLPARRICLPALVVLLALGLAACGGDDEPAAATTSPADSNAAFCASLDDLEAATADLKGLSPTDTSLSELATTATGLLTAGGGVLSAAKDDVDIDTAALSQAWDDVKAAIRDIPGSGQSPSQALGSVQDALEPVEGVVSDLKPSCEE